MTNEIRAGYISSKYEDWWRMEEPDVEKASYDSAMEMAEWKEQKMIEKAEEYIYEKFNSGLIVSTNIVSFVEGMKQAMKGE